MANSIGSDCSFYWTGFRSAAFVVLISIGLLTIQGCANGEADPRGMPGIYVRGAVNRPGKFDADVPRRYTIALVIAFCDGIDGDARWCHITVLRGPEHETVAFSDYLDAILEGTTSDMTLLPGDIVDVTIRPK